MNRMDLEENKLPAEVRSRALEMLSSKGKHAIKDVEKLLGLGTWWGMDELARRLGITRYKLKYVLARDYFLAREKDERIAKEAAASIQGEVVMSQELGFRIWLPNGWKATQENDDVEDVSIVIPGEKQISTEEAYRKLLDQEHAKVIGKKVFNKLFIQDKKRAYITFFKNLLGTPTDDEIDKLASKGISADEAYKELMADPETFIVDFADFKNQYELQQEQQRVMLQSELQLREKQGSQVGYWLAESTHNNIEDMVSVEVTKFKFREPMTSLAG